MSALIDAAVQITDVAASQAGLVTTAQAASVGVTRLELSRLVERGLLERVTHGVYAFRVAPDINKNIRAEWLALEPGMTARERRRHLEKGVASHTTATIVHDLGDFLEGSPEFTLPTRKQSRRGVRMHRGELARSEVVYIDGILVTTVERTIADLIKDGHDLDHVSRVVREALHEGSASVAGIAGQIEPLAQEHDHASGREFVEFLMEVAGMESAPRYRSAVSDQNG